jgi:ATP sulfurylase
MTQKEILCTLGPSSLNDGVIGRLEELGVRLFRLNLSHTKVEDLAEIIEYVQSRTSVPLCLDTEGAQVRTNGFVDRVIKLRDSAVVRIKRALVPGDVSCFNLYPTDIVDQLAEGDFLKVDSSVLLQVIDVEQDGVAARVLAGGEIGQNKAVTVERSIPMPPLTEKDRQALAIGRAMGIRHVALSFASRASDLDDPRLQKRIIRCGKQAGIKVYVATNLMESMVTQAAPTRAEVNDVYNTLADGADGLVLAAETAVGQFPVGCASMVVKITREFEEESWGTASHMPTPAISLLVDPHGGRLVDRVAEAGDVPDLEALPSVVVDNTVLMDCEQIANGTYSPLAGFMCRETLQSVLDRYRLPNGLPWTMPIVLQVPKSAVAGFREGDRIALRSESGEIHAVLDVAEIYSFDLDELFTKWFGTSSPSHPGVARLHADDTVYVGGDILLLRPLASALAQYKLTPAQTRFVFGQTGWTRVVGFHTRNVPHRAHEFIQMRALEMTHADGLLISPVIGSTRVGDFLPDWIMKSYRLMIDFGIYPRDKVLLTCFATYPRYCGPREAVFTAICRKNMGCSHFILGRDHTGIGDFYSDAQTRELFANLDDIGITPLFFDVIGYNPQTRAYCPVDDNGVLPISGSEVRRSLSERGTLPGWYVRDNVQQMLLSAIGNGEKILHEDE